MLSDILGCHRYEIFDALALKFSISSAYIILTCWSDGEPFWNGYLGQWQGWVNFADGCRSFGCVGSECVEWFKRGKAVIADCELRSCNYSVSVTNNIELTTQVADTPHTSQTLNEAVGGWQGLKLRLRQGLESAGSIYQQLVSSFGEAIGVADGEPFWNGYLRQWQVWVNFGDGCRVVGCDWLVVV